MKRLCKFCKKMEFVREKPELFLCAANGMPVRNTKQCRNKLDFEFDEEWATRKLELKDGKKADPAPVKGSAPSKEAPAKKSGGSKKKPRARKKKVLDE